MQYDMLIIKRIQKENVIVNNNVFIGLCFSLVWILINTKKDWMDDMKLIIWRKES
mgnify:CR=1 FL=1